MIRSRRIVANVLDEVGAHHAACPHDQCCPVGQVTRSFIAIS